MPKVVFCPTSRLSSYPRKVQVRRRRHDFLDFWKYPDLIGNKYMIVFTCCLCYSTLLLGF